jgi:hypothetical protein
VTLLEAINNRPVGFIGHGHSLFEFRKNIERFRGLDICWVSLNHVQIARDILELIDEDLSIILGFADGYEDAFEDEKCFVLRDGKCRGNSLSEFLHQCIECGVPLVFCVGCDGWSTGYSVDGNMVVGEDIPYYSLKDHSYERIQRHKFDCEVFNRDFPDDTGKTKIFNLYKDSKYKLNKITYDELFEMVR